MLEKIKNKMIYKVILIGFLLVPFNNFPNLKVSGTEFSFSFLWAVLFLVISTLYIFMNNIKIKNNLLIKGSFLFLLFLNLQLIVSILFIKEIDDIKPIAREFIYSNVWIYTFILLYTFLGNYTEELKIKLMKISIYSFSFFGLIESLNIYLKIYPKNITKALDINRINPLSSESSYFIVNFVIIVSILLFKRKDKTMKVILIYFLLQMILTFSTTGLVALIMILFIYILKNIKKVKFYKILLKINIIIILIILIVSFMKFELLKKSYDEISHQIKKVSIYINKDKKGDYSGETRKKVKQIFGENLFKKSPIFGVGTGGIYRYSKYNKIAYDNEINSDAKNVYWTILAEQGIVGFFNYLIYLILIIYSLLKKETEEKQGFLVGLLVLLVLFNAYNKIWIQSIWIYLAFVLSESKVEENKMEGKSEKIK